MLNRSKRIWRSQDGIAAVEFAFVAPLLIVLLLGTIEVCNALECRQKVISTSSSVADLVAMATSVNSNDIANAYNAGNSILYPFPDVNTTIVISSIKYSSATNQDKVDWSRAQNGTPLTQGSVVAVPTGIIPTTDGDGAILVSVTYTYTSPIGKLIIGSIPMTDAFYAHPRESASVACNGC